MVSGSARGCCRTWLLPHFESGHTVIVQDGYIRTQLERLRKLAELARGAGVRRIEVVAKPWRPGELADEDTTAPDPLTAFLDSSGGITWSMRTSTLHHDRQIKILLDDGLRTTVDLGRGLDMYYAAQASSEDQRNSDTLRSRETVIWTRTWTARDTAQVPLRKCRGTTAAAQNLWRRGRRGSSADWRNDCGNWCGFIARGICWTRSTAAPCNAGRPWSSRSRSVDSVGLARIPRQAKPERAPCTGAASPTGPSVSPACTLRVAAWSFGSPTGSPTF